MIFNFKNKKIKDVSSPSNEKPSGKGAWKFYAARFAAGALALSVALLPLSLISAKDNFIDRIPLTPENSVERVEPEFDGARRFLAVGDDGVAAGMVGSSTTSITSTSVVNPVLSPAQKTALGEKFTALNYSIATVEDFYVVALYIYYYDGAVNPTAGHTFNYLPASVDAFTLPSTFNGITPSSGSSVYFTDNGAADGTPLSFTYPGLGTANFPFAGILTSINRNTTLTLSDGCVAMFNYAYSSMSAFPNGFVLNCGAGGTTRGGFIQNLIVDNTSATLPDLTVSGAINNTVSSIPDAGFLFGSISSPTASTLTLNLSTVVINGSSVQSSFGNAGSIIGSVGENVNLTLNYPSFSYGGDVISLGNSAGGLIGLIEGSVSIQTASSYTFSGDVKGLIGATSGGNAGGLIGTVEGSFSALGTLSITLSASKQILGTFYSTNSTGGNAGGLIGNLSSGSATVSGALTLNNPVVRGGFNAGGLIGYSDSSSSFTRNGVLGTGIVINNADVLSAGLLGSSGGFIGFISNSSVSGLTGAASATFTLSGAVGGGANVGGFIGKYDYPVSNALIADNGVNIGSSTTYLRLKLTSACTHAGGLIGIISGKTGNLDCSVGAVAVYVNCDISDEYPTTSAFGGLIGKLNAKIYCGISGAKLYLDKTPTINVSGMLIGRVAVDCIAEFSGNTTIYGKTTSKCASSFIATCGSGAVIHLTGSVVCSGEATIHNMVVEQNDSLIYADTFTLTRNSNYCYDDIGNYGQIIRNSAFSPALITKIDNHNYSIGTVAGATSSAVTLANETDLAKYYITVSSHGVFSAFGDITYAQLLDSSITLSADAYDLSNNGIESLTRLEGSDKFSGSITGKATKSTVTLNIGVRYPDTNADLLQGLYGRGLAGLIYTADDASFTNLIIAGKIDSDDSIKMITYYGGLASKAEGEISISNCSATLEINSRSGSKDHNCYYGGFIGYYSGNLLSITNSGSSAVLNIKKGNETLTAYVGGFIGYVSSTGGTFTLTNLTVSADINYTDGVCDFLRVGGIIATISSTNISSVSLTGLNINGCSVTGSANKASGGLIGYDWSTVNVSLGGSVNGTVDISSNGNIGGLFYKAQGKITLNSGFTVNGTFSGHSTCASASDGLIVCDGTKLFLVVKCAPTFVNASATVSNNTTGKFDYLVGNSISEYSLDGLPTNGGVVSIETSDGVATMPLTGSDWYDLPVNPRTRYHYNVEALENASLDTTQISSAANLVQWGLRKYVNGALNNNFFTRITNSGFTLTQDLTIDLSRICFYPANNPLSTFDLNGGEIIFAEPPSDCDTSASAQYYAIKNGLFVDVWENIDVVHGELSGTIGKNSTGSGAISAGRIFGNPLFIPVDICSVNLNNLIVSDLKVSGIAASTAYAPLLINKITTCATISATAITADSATLSATSLFGIAGGDGASEINISFSDIKINGKTSGAAFNRASLLESYISATGICTYNFNRSEGWYGTNGSNGLNRVTYGQELGTTVTYYDDATHVTATSSDPLNYDFKQLPYIWLPYIYDGSFISVNERAGDLDNGCGTVGDPYVIANYNQLLAVYNYILNRSASNGWTVNYPNNASCTGAAHTAYVYGTDTLPAGLVSHLCGAYYKLNGGTVISINSDTFTGLGTSDNPFHGKFYSTGSASIVYANPVNGSAEVGFVKFADGCYVQNVNVKYNGVTLSTLNNAVFGGVIGTVVGGDNFIDNSVVSFENGSTVSSSNRISFLGGYVGLIKLGGVIFRNMTDLTGKTFTLGGSQYFYANPFVGRVLDGFALAENQTLNNTDKNYFIPNVNTSVASTAHGLSVSRASSVSSASISSGEGLYLFAAAFNSNSLYSNGYLSTLIGFNGSSASSDKWNITFTADTDVSAYKNGFRGIGGTYGFGPTLKLTTLDGGGKIVKMDYTLNQYVSANPAETSSPDYETFLCNDIGLINKIGTASEASTVKDLTVRGSISSLLFSAANGTGMTRPATSVTSKNFALETDVNVGGVIGGIYLSGTVNFTNVIVGGDTSANGFNAVSQGSVGGLVGYDYRIMTIKNCGVKNANFESFGSSGGFVGMANNAITLYSTDEQLSCENISVKFLNGTLSNSLKSGHLQQGCGGLLGFVNGNLSVNSLATSHDDYSDLVRLNIKNVVVFMENPQSVQINEFGFGGMVGGAYASTISIKNVRVTNAFIASPSGSDYSSATEATDVYNSSIAKNFYNGDSYSSFFLKNITLTLNNYSMFDSPYNPAVGGIVGTCGFNGSSYNAKTLSLYDSEVRADGNGGVILIGNNNAGGLVGECRYKNGVNFSNCGFNPDKEEQTRGNAFGAGGSRFGGMIGWVNSSDSTFVDCKVGDASTSNAVKTYFIAFSQSKASTCGGIIGDSGNNKFCTFTDCSIFNTVLSGVATGGLAGRLYDTYSVNGFTAEKIVCFSKGAGTDPACGLMVGRMETDGNLTMRINDVSIQDSSAVSAIRGYAGGLIGYVKGETGSANSCTIIGNEFLWKNNRLSVSAASNYVSSYESDFLSMAGSTSAGGIFTPRFTGTFTLEIVGFSRMDAGLSTGFYKDTAAGEYDGITVVYSSYGAENLSQVADDNNKLAPNPTAYGGLTLNGDALFYDDTVRRATTLNTTPWTKNQWNETSFGALSNRLITYSSIDTSAGAPDLPLFHASNGIGSGADAFIAYLNLLTNDGFSKFISVGGTVSATSTFYTYTDGQFAGAVSGGSIVWNGSTFVEGTRYDNIVDGGTTNSFTVITVTFTHSDGTANRNYTMDIPIYFPQILNMTTKIIPLGYEEYSASVFVDNSATSTVNALSNGFFSLYIEYMYNQVRMGDEWNLAKKLNYFGTNRLPVGTRLILIDLNVGLEDSDNYGQSYVYVVNSTSVTQILFSEFVLTDYPYVNLCDLKSVSYYTTTATNESIYNAAGDGAFGIERYLLVAQFPTNNVNASGESVDYGWTADVINTRNIQIEGNQSPTVAAVKVWNTAQISVSSEQESYSVIVQKESGISLFVNSVIDYQTGYALYEGDSSAWYGVFGDPWLTNALNQRVDFPVGTQISYSVNPGSMDEDLLVRPVGDENRDHVERNYCVFISFENVDPEVYRTFASASSSYVCHIKYYLSQEIDNPASGIPSLTVNVELAMDDNVPLAITVTGPNNSLGVNVYDKENDIIDIDFNVFAELSHYEVPATSQLVIRLYLIPKENGLYSVRKTVENGTLYSSDGTISINGTYWLLDATDLVSAEHTLSANFSFSPQIDSGFITAYKSYKLCAEVVEISSGGTETVISGMDYFIFLVANMKTDID